MGERRRKRENWNSVILTHISREWGRGRRKDFGRRRKIVVVVEEKGEPSSRKQGRNSEM